MDYTNGKIYTIRSYLTDKYYIGSTIQPLCKRMVGQKSNYKNYLKNNSSTYVSSYEVLKFDDAYIELLELFPTDSKIFLNKREGEWIRQNKQDVVNINIAGRSHNEWVKENERHVAERRKKYYAINKEKIWKYFEDNKEALKLKRQEKQIANKKPNIQRTQQDIETSKKRKIEKEKIRRAKRSPEKIESDRIRHNKAQRLRRENGKSLLLNN
jgi:hypothetical protein